MKTKCAVTPKWWNELNSKQRKYRCNKERKITFATRRSLNRSGTKKKNSKSKSCSWRSRKYWKQKGITKSAFSWNWSSNKKRNCRSKCWNKGKWNSFKNCNKPKMYKNKHSQNLNKSFPVNQKILQLWIRERKQTFKDNK